MKKDRRILIELCRAFQCTPEAVEEIRAIWYELGLGQCAYDIDTVFNDDVVDTLCELRKFHGEQA